jgi:hypothetical protein
MRAGVPVEHWKIECRSVVDAGMPGLREICRSPFPAFSPQAQSLHAAFLATRDAFRTMTPTHVHAEELAGCPFSIAEEYAAEYLRRAERGGTEAVLHVPLGGFPGLGKTVSFGFGIRENTEEHRPFA